MVFANKSFDQAPVDATVSDAQYVWLTDSTGKETRALVSTFESGVSDAAKLDKATFPVAIPITVGDETTAISGTGEYFSFRLPFAMTLTEIRASLVVAAATGTFTIDVNMDATTLMSATKLTIDATELTSTTAVNPALYSTTALTDDAEITIDVDDNGDATNAKGLKLWLIGTRVIA